MQLKKFMVSLGVLFCLCSTSVAVAYADTTTSLVDNDISLAYEIAEYTTSTLSIINRTASCVSTAKGSSTVKITVTQTLQKHWGLWIWNDVKGAEWASTVDRNSISFTNSKSDLESGTYRVKSVFTLTDKNGKTETITIYSSEKNIG